MIVSTNDKKLLIFSIVSLFVMILSLTIYTHQAEAQKQPKLIKESFIVQSYSNGTYKAKNTQNGTDKAYLYFSDKDINGPVKVGQKVIAYYKPLKGEDQFLYAKISNS
jgi:hypothetical protein